MRSGARTGRPPLSEGRRAQVRLEIARAAVRLFTEKGVAATSVEDIAAAAGISPRTFWRYCTSKENCVRPLLTAATDVLASALASWRPGQDVDAVVAEVTGAAREPLGDVPTTLGLVRLARTDPGLRGVWLQAHDDAEAAFAAALARSTGSSPDDLHVAVGAAMVNAALRAAVEHHARRAGDDDADGLLRTVREALRTAVRAFG
ncbi:TetR/AcrR family transcriptional regulator [Saccharothrix sp. Mg75]|uniref:TetR/AcrR family transcriptional regulator n=1 Tax=Saccharothrix sp. Mg75 TaxID=3445357 RepID=UPI003EED51FA